MSTKEESKPAVGSVHPASCWGHWDDNFQECRECLIGKRCSDTTRRIASGAGFPVVEKEVAKKVKPPEPEPIPDELDDAPAIPSDDLIPAEEMERVLSVRMKFKPTETIRPVGSLFTFTSVDGCTLLKAMVMKDGSQMKLVNGTGQSAILVLPCTPDELKTALDSLL